MSIHKSGTMDLPLPTVSLHMGGSHVDLQQSGTMDLPLPTLTGMQPTLGPTASGCLQPSESVLVQNKDLWKEEHATKLANKLARYFLFW